MPADTSHPYFQQPENEGATIWRYMDFAKYVALLRSQALYLCRLDLMGDEFEGSLAKAEFERLKEVAAAGEARGDLPDNWKGRYLDVLLQNVRNMRRSCYASCWHMNSYESEAMWRLYSDSGFAIALRSTYGKLREALPTNSEGGKYLGSFLGKVTYLDHATDEISAVNGFTAVMNKRPSFLHEQECRVLVWRPEPPDYVFHADPEAVLATYPRGLNLKLNLSGFIDLVVVSPTAPAWFSETVADVTRKYGLNWEVRVSALAEKPFY